METKRFSMSRRTYLFFQFVMIIIVLFGIVIAFLLSLLWESYVRFLLIGVSLIYLYALWILFKQPYEVILDDKQIIFRTFLGSVRMELDDLISIECNFDSEHRTNAKVKSKKRSFRFAPPLIKGWDEIIEDIRSVNPRIEVKWDKVTDRKAPQPLDQV